LKVLFDASHSYLKLLSYSKDNEIKWAPYASG